MKVKELKMDLEGQEGCIIKDIIYVPISPSNVKYFQFIFENKLLSGINSITQLEKDKDIYDSFREIYDEWEKRRENLKEKMNE